MKILVTGSTGQLGSELSETLMKFKYEVLSLSREQFDITNYEVVERKISEFHPDVIINTAAYTKVDDCELNYEWAYKVNVVGPRNLAQVCEVIGAKLIHISTDFVFNGNKTEPYFEFDATEPLSVYGKTKLAGESAIMRCSTKYFVVRTSWLYGKHGNNFVKTMLKLAEARECIEVVSDQRGAPTLVTDLIEVLIYLMETEKYGLYHFSNTGECSWLEFANEVFEISEVDVNTLEISAVELNRLAVRPQYSVLDTRLIRAEFGIDIRDWKTALHEFLRLEKNAGM